MSQEKKSAMPVITIDITETGQMKQRLPRLSREEQLENTLLEGLYPGIRVARLNVPPGKLEDHQENEVQRCMRAFDYEGVRFRLIGASASAKSGKFYAVDERYEPMLAERFRKWPEAAITYFGILVSPCKQRIQMPDARVMIDLLGSSRPQEPLEEIADSEYTSAENTVVEAVLKVDSSGYLIKHPHINNALNRLLAKWTFKLCTAGGFKIPGFALADDGFLALHNGQVVAASDWLPQDRTICGVSCAKGLVVRYPIRMFEDLLPVTRVSTEEAVDLVAQAIEEQNGCSMEREAVVDLVEKQIQLDGTLTLNSETAAKNGGDFDFDLVALVEGDRFPRFVDSRFAHKEWHEKGKTKRSKKQSPWWNLALVAQQAKGNAIGSITDLKTSCYAAGLQDEAYLLVDELQHALDSLKWGTEIDQQLVAEIRRKVPLAPWLKFKDKERVSDFPVHLEVLPTDRIGYLYNLVRKEVEDFFSAKLPITDFHGLISGEHFTKEMSQECRLVNRIYADEIGKLIKEQQALEEALAKAEAEYQAPRNDPETRKELRSRRNAARSAVHAYKERFRDEFQALRSLVRAWGAGKQQNRRGWCQALHTIICAGKGNGSLLFHVFPQEVIDKVAEETGSNPVQVSIPDLVDGEIEFDDQGRVFLVEQFPNGDGSTHERKIFLLQVSKKGEVFMDGKVIDRVQPFPMRYGSGVIQDGKLVFSDIRQHPTVKRSRSTAAESLNESGAEGGADSSKGGPQEGSSS